MDCVIIRLSLQNLFDRQDNPEVDAEVLEMRFAEIDFFVAIVPTLPALFQMELKQIAEAGALSCERLPYRWTADRYC